MIGYQVDRPTPMKTNKPTTVYILQPTVTKTTAADWLNLLFFFKYDLLHSLPAV
jgi:hypothetical protein